MLDTTDPTFWPTLVDVIIKATGETLFVVFGTAIITLIIGMAIGVVLVATDHDGVLARPFGSRALGATINRVTGVTINIGRSIPFIILMVALIPFSRWLMGSAFEVRSAIVPLSVAAIPFFARIVEMSLREVPNGLIEAGHAMGATPWQLIRHIILPEAVPGLILGFTTTVVTVINYSAIVGVIGAGGLGDVAIRYGHQRYSTVHIIATIVVLVGIVQCIQLGGSKLARMLDHR